MDIKIGISYGDFIIGMFKKEVINKFGKPNKTYHLSGIDGSYFEYNNEQVIIKFDVDSSTNNNRVSQIEVKDKNATIQGFQLWGLSKSKVKNIFEKELKTEASLEDYDTFETLSFDDFSLEFSFELGKLISINIDVILDENEDEIWHK